MPEMSPIGLTSLWVAAARAAESERPDALFRDPLAAILAGKEGQAAMERGDIGGTQGMIKLVLAIRTKFFDDAIEAALADGKIKQVVLLAAGMDTRAYRLKIPKDVVWFEVDRSDTVRYKGAVLASMTAVPRCQRRVVIADLQRDDWRAALCNEGFDEAKPALFLIEGLFVYLPLEEAEALMEQVKAAAATGSWLGLDMISRTLLELPVLAEYRAQLEKLGYPWRLGIEEPGPWLAKFGWRARVVAYGDPEANFGRWPYPVAPKDLPDIPRSYLITALREP